MDVSKTLDADMASYYKYIICIMKWIIGLACIDIATEVSMLSSHNAYPREGMFEDDFNICLI